MNNCYLRLVYPVDREECLIYKGRALVVTKLFIVYCIPAVRTITQYVPTECLNHLFSQYNKVHTLVLLTSVPSEPNFSFLEVQL